MSGQRRQQRRRRRRRNKNTRLRDDGSSSKKSQQDMMVPSNPMTQLLNLKYEIMAKTPNLENKNHSYWGFSFYYIWVLCNKLTILPKLWKIIMALPCKIRLTMKAMNGFRKTLLLLIKTNQITGG